MNITDTDKQKADNFIDHLISNPSLKNFSALQREEQIIQFLTVNSNQLFPTLSSQSFFPGKDWEDIKSILISSLYNIVNKSIVPDLQIIVSKLNLSFVSFFDDSKLKPNTLKKNILELLIRMLSNEQARRVFTGSLKAVKSGIIRNYVNSVYVKRKYIFFEITKVEHLTFTEMEALNLITLVTLLKPLIYLMYPNKSGGRNTVNGYVFQNSFTIQAAKNLYKRNPLLPYKVFKSAMNSNASFVDNNYLEATARLSNVLCALCRNYKTGMKNERGADTVTKSWLNIARKNYKFYGYDLKLIDELYNIAADNGW